MEEGLIRRLMATVKCSSCGQHLAPGDIDVLEHSEDVWFLRVVCSSCHTQGLIAAIIQKEKMEENGAEAVLDEAIVTEVVGVDDVLDMHNFLNNFDGDFTCLFRQEIS